MLESPGFKKTTILHIDINQADYSQFCRKPQGFIHHLGACPYCRESSGFWRRHGHYLKYCGLVQLQIIRVRCPACRKTHAIIPSFSVPHSSHATADIEAYYTARYLHQSRKQAVKGLSLDSYSYQTLRRLDQRIITRSGILKACQPAANTEQLFGYPFLQALAGSTLPIAVLNQRYLEKSGRAWLFGNLTWLCKKPSAGMPPSQNLDSSPGTLCAVDSS